VACSDAAYFFNKILRILLASCGPGYNLNWWWSDVTLSWPTICQQYSKKNFIKEYAALDHTMPIKIHKVREEF